MKEKLKLISNMEKKSSIHVDIDSESGQHHNSSKM